MKLTDITRARNADIYLIAREAEYHYQIEENPTRREEYRLLMEAGHALKAYIATGRAYGKAVAYVDSLKGREAFNLLKEIADELSREWHMYEAPRKVIEKRLP